MKYLMMALLLVFTAGSAMAQIDDDCKPEVVKLSKPVETTDTYEVYGDSWSADSEPASLAATIGDLEGDGELGAHIVSTVSEVCQDKGCWMVLVEGDTYARVHFKDYGFFVPSDITGRKVEVLGSLKMKTISEEQAQHYAEDAHHDNPESIKGPQKEYTLIASSVKVYK